MVDVAISSAHGLKVRGAKGHMDEVNESRRLVDRIAVLLRGAGVGVKTFHDNTSTSVGANLSAITNWHNSQKRDRDYSIHFNAHHTTARPMGTESLFRDSRALSTHLAAAMASAGRFVNRGAKSRRDLTFLARCQKPAALAEVCFVDSSHDVALYRQHFETIARAMAESMGGVNLGVPIEPLPPPPEVVEPPELTGNNVVDVKIEVTGEAHVIINGDPINDAPDANRLELTLKHHGDIVVTVNGEDFQVEQPGGPDKSGNPADYPIIRNGSRGPAVAILQSLLNLQADGIFGAQTEAAVRNFQSSQMLSADGIVGRQTWEALHRVYGLPPYEPLSTTWHENIKASVFGGIKDPNDSAYPPFNFINDTELSVALPWKFVGPRPQVIVRNRANGKVVTCQIRDVGPWLIDDCYWETGSRPLAEICHQNRQPLPRGKYKGKVPNGAGIDLTPGARRAIAMSTMGQVDWMFG